MKSRDSAWMTLRKRSHAIRRSLETLWGDVESALKVPGTDPFGAADGLASERAEWASLMTRVSSASGAAIAQLEPERRRQAEILDKQLSRELTARKFTVQGEAGLLIVQGFVHVEFNLAESKIKMNDQPVTDLSLASLVSCVETEVERLRKGMTPPPIFLERLSSAYDRELRLSGKDPGTQVESTALLLQLAVIRQSPGFRQNPNARNFREYPRELFRAELHGLLSSGNLNVGGRKLCFASGSDTAGSVFMMIPSLGRPAHLGRLWFEQVGR